MSTQTESLQDEVIAPLRRTLADAEWSGSWHDSGCGTVMCDYGGDPRFRGEHGEIAHPEPLGIAPYIAACSPDRIRRLLGALEEAQTECNEQARLNGMGAERELALQAKLSRAKDLLRELNEAIGVKAHIEARKRIDAFLKDNHPAGQHCD